jgi:hypothetical protein
MRFTAAYGTALRLSAGQSLSALPCRSDFDLFGNRERVVYLDTEWNLAALTPRAPDRDGSARCVAARVIFKDRGTIVEDVSNQQFFEAPGERAQSFLSKIPSH